MGAIKDIVDLAKDLESRAKDRHDMDTIHKIQSLAFALQSQYVETMERDVHLLEENAELKRKLVELQQEKTLIHQGIEFRNSDRTGNKWMGFCPKCHLPAQNSVIPGFGGTKVVACTAYCGWKVFTDLRLDTIAAEAERA
jgi:hypothetical protein